MRTYLILKDKARRFTEDTEIQDVIQELRAIDSAYDGPGAAGTYSRERAAAVRDYSFDLSTLANRGRRQEELDQLLVELLLGVR